MQPWTSSGSEGLCAAVDLTPWTSSFSSIVLQDEMQGCHRTFRGGSASSRALGRWDTHTPSRGDAYAAHLALLINDPPAFSVTRLMVCPDNFGALSVGENQQHQPLADTHKLFCDCLHLGRDIRAPASYGHQFASNTMASCTTAKVS